MGRLERGDGFGTDEGTGGVDVRVEFALLKDGELCFAAHAFLLGDHGLDHLGADVCDFDGAAEFLAVLLFGAGLVDLLGEDASLVPCLLFLPVL